MEHFVTLFDSGFLPQGLALYASLQNQGEPFILWVVCMDKLVEFAIGKMGNDNLKAIPLHQVEEMFPELLTIKPQRSRGEYCWTLTSFSYAAVMAQRSDIERVTYVDADVFFFGPASRLLSEMDAVNADVLLTEHAYAPEYAQESTAGIYCVQFLPIRNNEIGRIIMRWWQERCIEWCFARYENGKFGDQKYLDDWTIRWGKSVAVLKAKHLTLAPWNVDYYAPNSDAMGIYHFHGLRIYASHHVRLWIYYKISNSLCERIYGTYVTALKRALAKIDGNGIEIHYASYDMGWDGKMKRLMRRLLGRNEKWIRL